MIFRRRQENDLDNEIRDYIERETSDNIARGMSPADARHAAMRKFGQPILNVKEDTRAVWGWIWFERLWQDLRHGTRMLRKTPGFTVVAVLSLAIGIGANSAMFSLADAILLRPLPISHPSEVVTISSVSLNGSGGTSYPDYLDFRDHTRSFAGLVAFTTYTFGFSPKPGVLPQMKLGMFVTGNFFRAMGVEPELGRAFRPDEDQVPRRDTVVVLSHDLWEKQLASDHSVIGSKVRLSGIDFTVIGVAPARFTGMDQYLRPAFYVPIMMQPRITNDPQDHFLDGRDRRELSVKGRLKPGVSLAQARAELRVIAKSLEHAYPATNRNQSANVDTEIETRLERSPTDSQTVEMLMALSVAVLLVACANVAGLLLSRSKVRAREIALRMAIGAGRSRLIRQLLTERLLIASAGGILGLAVAYGGIRFLGGLQVPTDLPVVIAPELDQRALLVSLFVALFSVILFGLAPAIQTTRTNLVGALKTAGADTPGRRRNWGRKILVVGQVAGTMALLMAAAVVLHGFRQLLGNGPGFRTDHVLMMSFNPGLVRYDEAHAQRFYQQVAERARSTPGVKSVALAFSVPFAPDQDGVSIVPEGYRFPPGKETIDVGANTVDEHFFDTMAIPIIRGRGFLATDTSSTPHVAVVNEELAKHCWPGQNTIGKRFRLNDRNGPWVEIVGVTATGKYDWIGESPTEYLYLPLAQRPRPTITLLAESFGDPAGLLPPLRDVVRSLDADQPIYDVRTIEDFFQQRAIAVPNMITQIVEAMAFMGLGMAMIGLYGLVAYSASRRTREIGIRVAIGAQRSSVLRMIVKQGLTLSLIGIAVGLPISFAAERGLNIIFSQTGSDWLAYLIVTPALLAVTLLAAYIPARRASRVDPTTALRYE